MVDDDDAAVSPGLDSNESELVPSGSGIWNGVAALVSRLRRSRGRLSDTSFGQSVEAMRQRAEDASNAVHMQAERLADRFYGVVIRSPGSVVVLMLLVTALIGRDALQFQHQINGDVEIYLPDGADSTELLLDVREQWSTDIVILYVHSKDAYEDPSLRVAENVTDVDFLAQLSWLEGDDGNRDAGGYSAGLDPVKEDRGSIDGVVWILSAAQIIKEANSSSYRFNCAMERHAIPLFQQDSCPISSQNPYEGYSIPEGPNAQDRVDNLVDNAGSLMDSFVRDTNGNGIWDTTVIIIGIDFDMSQSDITPRDDPKGITEENPSGQIRDHKAFIGHVQEVIDRCPHELCHRVYTQPLSSMNEERIDALIPRSAITITGLTPVVHDVSDAVYLELVDRMLPYSLLFVAIAMIVLHRNPKVLAICGLPILMSLAITFGTTVILDIMLTPMIISAGPILVGLGVDYALHLINRIEENRDRILEKAAERVWEAERRGEAIEMPDPWDAKVYLSATRSAVMTTGHAILLSAVTTIIGFSVLTWTALVPIKPMRTVGTTLLLGITCTFFLSLVMVPALGYLLRYRKGRSEARDTFWKRVGQIPIRGVWVVLIVSMVVTAAGVNILSEEFGKEITGSSDEVPPNLQSYEALAEYSRVFEGGQTNMFIVNATDRGPRNDTLPIRDLPVLDAIDRMQTERIDLVENTTTISLVTILKSIHVSLNASGFEVYDDSLWGILHSPCWDNPTAGLECPLFQATSREAMVNVAFDTLSEEVRSMLVTEGEMKTLVYVNQPYINLARAGVLRDIIDDHLTGDGCIDALHCDAMGEEGVQNSLLTGGLPVSLDINDGIHDAQTKTTIATMLVLLLVMAVLFRSPRLAFFTMTAVGVVVLWQPLLMRGGSVNVNLFTAMIGTIVFGIGVDDSIHIVDRIKDEGETPSGIARSVEKTGQTIFETTATTSAGLAAGLLVTIPALRNFFVLMMLLIFLALLTSSFLLPSLIVAQREIAHRIRGGTGSWANIDEDMVFDSGNSIDAVIPSSDEHIGNTSPYGR